MEPSNDELRASIVAHELVLESVRSVVEKGLLSPSDEEHVMLCLHPSSIDASQIACLCENAEDKLGTVLSPPEKREIPGLRDLVEKELNQTFAFIDRLEAASGSSEKDQLTEHDILAKVNQIEEVSSCLVPELDKLNKRSKMTSQLVKESLDPIVNSASALKLELLKNLSDVRQLESSILNEKFRDVPNDVLECLVNDLEAEVAAVAEDTGEPEVSPDLAAAALKLKEINEEIELKKALLEAVFPDKL